MLGLAHGQNPASRPEVYQSTMVPRVWVLRVMQNSVHQRYDAIQQQEQA